MVLVPISECVGRGFNGFFLSANVSMGRVLECWGALLLDESQLKADALDAAARFKQNLTDWKDIFGDIDEPGRPDTPASRSQEVGLALGAQAGERRIREVVTSGGFTRFRRATETPFNLVFEARP